MAETYDFSHQRGTTWAGFQVEFLIDDVAVNLTGATIAMQVKKDSCDSQNEIDFLSSDGTISITDPTNGIFSIVSCIIDIPPRIYYYDIYVKTSSGAVYYPVSGRLTITENTTRL